MSSFCNLLLSGFLCAGPAEGPCLGSPHLEKGQELVYVGLVVEAGEAIDNRFRKQYDLEVRVFVLDVQTDFTDCAVMTSIRPRIDPVISRSAGIVMGEKSGQLPPAVRLVQIRLDQAGRAKLLRAGKQPDGLPRVEDLPPLPLETVPIVELGMFVPLPPKPVPPGTAWETVDLQRPPLVWKSAREAVWNGARCLVATAEQKSEGWNQPEKIATGWHRVDELRVSPSDGYACRVHRKIEQRRGVKTSGWVETTYELGPVERFVGNRFLETRGEIESLCRFHSEVDSLVAKGAAVDKAEFRVLLARLDRSSPDSPVWNGTKPSIESIRRQCEASIRGDAEIRSLPLSKLEPPGPDKLAPDFVAQAVDSTERFRLSSAKGTPVVLIFLNPKSKTAIGSLQVAEAMHRLYAGKIKVAALSVSGGTEAADRLRREMKLTVPIYDGNSLRETYGIDSYPKFFVIGGDGQVTWRFDGFGGETGYLVKQEVDERLKAR